MRWPGIPRARSRLRAWPGSCRWRTRPRWWPCAAGRWPGWPGGGAGCRGPRPGRGSGRSGAGAGPGYWYASLRAPVEFDRAVRVMSAAGHRVFIEVSPHPVLAAPVTEILEDDGGVPGAAGPVVTGTLRRGDGGARRFLASLAGLHVQGVRVDWAAVLGGGRRVGLPTYAFQRRRYWPRPSAVAAGDVASAGLGA